MTKPPANATTVERICWYVDHDQEPKAERLAHLADFLEACFEVDVYWTAED